MDLDICGFYLFLLPANYVSRVSEDGQGIGVEGSDLVLIINFLTSLDLPYFTQVFGCGFAS